MTHAMVTIVAPLDPDRLDIARGAIEALGNPATDAIAAKLQALDGDDGIHFASLHALPSYTAGKAHLVLEFSADRDEAWAIAWLAKAIGADLDPVFALASDRGLAPIGDYLASHAITTGFGLGANPGIGHAGNPGMSVGRIRAEQRLFAAARDLVTRQVKGGVSALDRLGTVREDLRVAGYDLTAAEPPAPVQRAGLATTLGAAAIGLATTYLWPALLVVAAIWLVGLGWSAHAAGEARSWAYAVLPSDPFGDGDLPHRLAATALTTGEILFACAAFSLKLVLVALLALVAVAAVLALGLLRQESGDWISDRAPDFDTYQRMFARESPPGYAHNHMMSLTERKPGWLRYFTSRLVFFGIATAGPRLYPSGHLGPIGTIHFARWITIPGTRDLVFFSNYGGSWESYLEDFITLAHSGLTGVWSNTVGFPRTTGLVFRGATDGERFKRYARQSMLPTPFWYSAYPALDTDMIRANADIRRGLSGAMTEDDAALWLSRFGSALRPDVKLVTSEIQSLVFGGLGFLPYATATFWTLPADQAAARAWLKDLAPHIAWNDGRRVRDDDHLDAIVQLGLSASGLAALGLPDDGLKTFPLAFQAGMGTRAGVLGDSADHDRWWTPDTIDAAVIVYGQRLSARDDLYATLRALSEQHGATWLHEVPLQDLPERAEPDRDEEPRFDDKAGGKDPDPAPAQASENAPDALAALASGSAKHVPPEYDPEPFGFADGISQPLILGTYKAERPEAHPLHIVKPGEFVLGYPDDRGNLPPGPRLDPIHDPANVLSLLDPDASYATNDVNQPRDLGRNGTFLVIRQLEQDVAGFKAYCEQEAARLKGRLKAPYVVTPAFIGAKMVGRWQNGAALVRSPYTQSRSKPIIDENAFKFGEEDPEGLRCPFGAHIRRANPRDSLDPGSDDQVAISNRHRILRVGRKYVPDQAAGQKPGILFMCLNGDIERQFEFVQQTWLGGNVISLKCPTNLSGERDPIVSDCGDNTGFTIPTRDGPVKLATLPRFVTMRGGGYFFMPGKRLVTYLSAA